VQAGAPGTLDPALRPGYLAADTAAERLRVVVDQIASLTDTSAIAWHDRLCRDRRPVPRNRAAGRLSASVAAVRKGPSDVR